MTPNVSFPAEWYPQSGIQLTWPHPNTDWAYMLDEVTDCYKKLASEISQREKLIIVTPCPDEVKKQLQDTIDIESVRFIECLTNDTWARDHGGITVFKDGVPVIYENKLNFVLEGGALESDGAGTLLTTSECLLSPNRNGEWTRPVIEEYLKRTFGLQRILWLDHGYLAGDDTDSHIDTLARFADEDTIVYVQCSDSEDEHYEALRKMEAQLQTFTTIGGKPYNLLPLPMPEAVYDENGVRLPATYANFLILNDAILYPTYRQPLNDKKAFEILRQAFPNREVVGIDCSPLIRQHGSLHCVTMQYPRNVLR